MPVFILQLQVNVFPLELFFVLFSIFYQYQPVLVKTFALISQYLLDFAIVAVLGNMTCLALEIFLISHLLYVGNFPQTLC